MTQRLLRIYGQIIVRIWQWQTIVNLLKPTKGLGIIHLNCRSLTAKRDEVFYLMKDWEIVTFSETWFSKKHDRALTFWPGRYCFRLDRTRKKGGGVACYVPTELAAYCSINKALSAKNEDVECLAINVNKPDNKRMLVCSIYRPPGANIDKFCEHLQLIGENCLSEIWLCGDYNIDFKKTNGPCCKKVLSKCRVFSWTPLINKVTRLKDDGGTCIDNILTNCVHVAASGFFNQLVSDHLLNYYDYHR